MGRLFWKFFIFTWLAQMTGMVAVGTVFWSRHHIDEQHRIQIPHPCPNGQYMLPPPPHVPHSPIPVEPLGATLLASLICAVLLARYFSSPIRRLRSAFEAASGGNLEARVGDSMGRRRDELADLGQDFDRMASRLKQVMDAQRRLLHDVSHEMRSPLARLQIAVSLARQKPERIPLFFSRVEDEIERMDKLVGELLTLAGLDAGVFLVNGETVDLGELVHAVVEDARFEAAGSNIQASLPGDAGVIVRGKAELLHHAVENVVRNALKHSPQGGTIRVAMCKDEETRTVTLRVSDEGAGVAVSDLPHLFEPFYRGSAAQDGNGYGLGLAIAERAIRLHGGSIHAGNIEGGGFQVEIILPMLSS